MNRTFKVVFNRARACLMVANEITSSVQKKSTKTVVAAAVAAAILGAGFEALATTYTTEQNLTADTTFNGDLFNSQGRITIKDSISAKLQNTTHSLITYSEGNGAAISVSTSGATVELNNSNFQNNKNSSNPGGAISVGGKFTSDFTKFSGNSASSGGAIYTFANADITGNLFTTNTATGSSGDGGAIYVSSNTTTIGSTKFVLNSAKRYGGAIYLRYYVSTNSSSALNLNAGTQFLSNKGAAGGAIYADGKTLNITGTGTEESSSVVFDSNESTSGEGGAIYLSDYTEATITYAAFKGNEASTSGGAIYLKEKSSEESTATSPFTNLTFTSNKATQGGAIFVGSNRNLSIGSTNTFTSNTSTGTGGGAIYLDNKSTLALGDTSDVLKFTGNTATNYGGAIYSKGTLSVTNTSFSTSKAKTGGALYLGNSATIEDSTFTSNVATTSGGAIYSGADSLTLNNSTFKGNSSTDSLIGNGGALYAAVGLISLSGVTFGGTEEGEGNTAGKHGGAIYLYSSKDNTITDSSFIGNTATAGYGGAIAFGSATSKLTITGTNTFTGNTAKTFGGAIYNQGTLTIGSEADESVTAFKSNSTAGFGGAIDTTFSSSDNSKVNLAVYNALFGGSETGDGNSAASGGAIAARTYSVSSVSGSTFTANKATSYGGAIYAAGTSFGLTGSTFTGNTAYCGGAIYQAGGTLTINAGSTFGGDTDSDGNKASGYAGAIYVSSGTLNITGTESSDVSFKKNTSDRDGGAIYFGNGTNATVEYATFEENRANSWSGAIGLLTGSTVTIKNSTFTSNSGTYGGVSYVYGTLNVLGTNTFTSNESRTQSGGVFYVPSTNNAVLVVGESGASTYSTFTKNTAKGVGGAIHIIGGTGTIYSGHFEENEAGASGGAIALGSVTTATSIVGSSTNKLLFTKNVAKGTGSSGGGAIYVSSTTGEKTIGHATFTENTAAVNGGAILLSSYTPTSLVTISDSTFTGNTARTVDSDGNYVDGFGGAIYLTARSAAETIDASPYTSLTFESNRAGTAGAIYVGAKRKLSIGSTNSFASNASTGTTAGTGGGAIFLAENATLTLGDSTSRLKFDTNSATYAGGAVYTQGTLNVTNTDFTTNSVSANVGGGALYVANGITSLTGTNTFTSNSATRGGAIYVADGDLTIGNSEETTKTTFKSNSATTKGGAIYINNGTHSITNATFGGTDTNEENTAENGGAIYVAGAATTTIVGVSTSDAVTFTANKATEGAGGAIYATAASTTNLKNAAFTSNTATTYGGALNIEETATKLDADAVTFTSNTASNAGGAIAARSNSVSSVSNSAFKANKATIDGGAIYAAGLSFDVSHSTFTDNTAQFGGAINATGASIDVSDSTFTTNSASSNGGALYVAGATTTTIGGASTSDTVTFTSNTATAGDGGAIYATDGSTTNLKNASFTSNTAMYGGALNIAGAATNLDIDAVTFTNNKGTLLGGAVTFSSLSVAQTGSITFTDVTFEKNESASAGAVSLGTKRVASIDGTSAFLGNKATSSHGGAIAMAADSSLTISGTTSFKGNTAASGYYGGAIYSAGTLDVTDASFGGAATGEANTATYGGAIYAGTDSKLKLQDSTFTANVASNSGGAIHLTSVKDNTITASSFIGNTATTGYGGAIYLDGTLNASGASFGGAETSDANKASYGGAVYADVASKLTLGTSTFTGNVATTSGGAIYLNSANENSIAATSFTGNTAANGGAIYLASGSSSAKRSLALTGANTFTQNTSSAGSGGALYVGSYVTVDGTGADSVVFTGNKSSSNGGAIYVDQSSTVTLKNGQFTDNVADTSKSTKGGALYLGENASATISATETYAITGNKAALGGFAYLGKSASLTLEAAEGNVLTVGKEGNVDTEIDSIASDDTFTSTLALQGAGKVVIFGKTSDYSGNVEIGTDSSKTTAEVAGTFSSAIRSITLGEEANLTIKGDQEISSDRDSESSASITLGNKAQATLTSLTLAASDAANVTTDDAGKKTASKKALVTLNLGEESHVTIENTLTVGDCATLAITGARSTTEAEAKVTVKKLATGNGSSTSIGSETSEKVRVEVADFALDDQSAVKVKNGATLATTSAQIDAMKQGVATSFEEEAWLEFTDNGTVEESTFETLLKSTGDTSDNAQNIRFENGVLQASDGDKNLQGDVNLHIGQMTGFDKATVEANRELILGKANTTSDVTEINTDATGAKLNVHAGKLVTKTKSVFTNLTNTDAFATTLTKKYNVTIGDSSTTGSEVSFDFIDEGTATLSAYTAMQTGVGTTDISLSNATLAADASGDTLEVKDNGLTFAAATGFEKITVAENVTFNLGSKSLSLASVVDDFDLTASGAELNLNGGTLTTKVAALFTESTASDSPFTGVEKREGVTVADTDEVINFTDKGTATLTEYEALRTELKSGTDEKLLNVNLVNATVKADSETTFTTDTDLTFGALSGFETVTVAEGNTLSIGTDEASLESSIDEIALGENSKLNLTAGKLSTKTKSLFTGVDTDAYEENLELKEGVAISNSEGNEKVDFDFIDEGTSSYSAYKNIRSKVGTSDVSLSHATLKTNETTDTFAVLENQELYFGAFDGFNSVSVAKNATLHITGDVGSAADAESVIESVTFTDDTSKLYLDKGKFTTRVATFMNATDGTPGNFSNAYVTDKNANAFLSSEDVLLTLTDTGSVSHTLYDSMREKFTGADSDSTKTALKSLSLTQATLTGNLSTDTFDTTIAGTDLTFGAMKDFAKVTVAEGKTLYLGHADGITMGLVSKIDDFGLTATGSTLNLIGGTLNTNVAALYTGSTAGVTPFTGVTKKTGVAVTNSEQVINFLDTGAATLTEYETLRTSLKVGIEDHLKNVNLLHATVNADSTTSFTTDASLTFGALSGFDGVTVSAGDTLTLGDGADEKTLQSKIKEITLASGSDGTTGKLNISGGKLTTKSESLFERSSVIDGQFTDVNKKSGVTVTQYDTSIDLTDEGTATHAVYDALRAKLYSKTEGESTVLLKNLSLSSATLKGNTAADTFTVEENQNLSFGAMTNFANVTLGANSELHLLGTTDNAQANLDSFTFANETDAKLFIESGSYKTQLSTFLKPASEESTVSFTSEKRANVNLSSNVDLTLTDTGRVTHTDYVALQKKLTSADTDATKSPLTKLSLSSAILEADTTSSDSATLEKSFAATENLTFGAMTGFDTVTVSDAKTLTLSGAKESSKTFESHIENITLGEGSKLSLAGGRLATMSTSLFESKVSEGTATSQFAANENKKANVLIANGAVGVDLLDLGVCDIAVYEDLKGKLATVDGSVFNNLSLSNATLKANEGTKTFTVSENQYLSFGAMSGFDTVTVKAGGELNLGTLESSANAVALEDVSNLNLQGGTIHTTRASLLAGVSFADATQKSGINILSADANVDFIDGGATVSKTEYFDKVRASLKVSGTSETLKGVSLSRSTLSADDSAEGKAFTTDATTLKFGALSGFETVTVSEGNTLHVGYTGLTSTVDNFNLTASEAKLYLDGGTLNTKAGALFTSTDSVSGTDGVFTNLTKKAVTVTDAALVINLKDTGTCLFADYDRMRSDLGVLQDDSSVAKLLNVNLENATLKADTTTSFTTEANLTFGAIDGFTKVTVGAGKSLTVGNATHGLATGVDTFVLAEGSKLNLIGGSVATKTASLFTGVDNDAFAGDMAKNANVTIANSESAKNVSFDFIDEGTAELTTYKAILTAVATDDVSLSKATLHANTEDKTFTVSSTLTKDGITFAAMTDFTSVTVGPNKTLTLGNKDLLEVSSIETITLSSDSAATSGKLHLTGGKLKTKAQSILTGIGDDLTANTVTVKDAVTIDNDDTTKLVSFDFINKGTATLSSYTAMQKGTNEGGLGTTDISLSNATLAADDSGKTLEVKDNGLTFGAATGFEKITVNENVTFNLGNKTLGLVSTVDDFDLTTSGAKLNLNGGKLTTKVAALLTGSSTGETPFTGVTKKEGVTVSDSSEVINFTDQGSATLAEYEALRTALKRGDDEKLLNVNLINATVKADSGTTFTTDTDLTFGAMAGFETVKVADGNTLSIGTDAANLESSIDEITLGAGSKLNLTAGKLSTKTKSLFAGTDSGAYATDLALKEGVTISNSEGLEKVSFDFIDQGASSLTAYQNIRSKVGTNDVSLSNATLEANGEKNLTIESNLTFGSMTNFNKVTVEDGKTLTIGKADTKSDIKTISLGTGSALTVAGGELATGRSQLIDEVADSFTKKDGITLDARATIDINDGIETTYADYQKLQSALGQNAATPLAGLSLSKSLLKGDATTAATNDLTTGSNLELTFGAIEDLNSITIGNGTKVYVAGEVLGADGTLVDASSTLNNVLFGNDASQLVLLNGKVVTEAKTFLTANSFDAESSGHVVLSDAVDVTLTNEGEITHSVYNALKVKLPGAGQQDHAKLSLNKAVLKADTAETGGKSFTATEDLTFGAMTGFETVTVGGESADQTLTLNGATVDGKTVASEITDIVLSGNSKLDVAGGTLKTKSASLFASAISDGSNFGTQDKKDNISIAATAGINLTDTGTCTFDTYEALRERLGDGTIALANLSLSNALLKGDGTSNLTVGSGQALSFGAISSFNVINVTTGGKLTIGDTNEDLSSLLGDASLTIDNVSALNLAGGKISAKRTTLVEGADFANSSAKAGVNVLSQDVEINITDRIAGGVTVSEYNKVREALGVKDSSGSTTEALKNVSLSQSALVGSNDTFTADASVSFAAMQDFSTVALNGKTLHIGNKDVNLESTVGDFDFTGEGSAVSFEGGSLRTKVAALFGTDNVLKGDATVTNADFVLNLTDTEIRTLTDYEALRTALSNDAVKFRNVNMENATIAADTTTVFDADTNLTFGAMTDFDKVTVSGGKTLSLGKNNSEATPFASTIKDFDLSNGHLKLEGGTLDTTIAALFKDGASDAVKNVTVTNSDVVVNFTDNTTTNLSDYEAMRQSLNNVNDTTSNHLVNVNLKEGTLKADSETTFTSDGNLSFGAMSGFTEVGAATGCELHIGKAGSNLVSTIDNIEASGNVYLEGGTLNTYAAGLLTGSGSGDSLLSGANKKTGITVTDKALTVNFKDEGTALLSNYNAVRKALQAESSDESLKTVNLENATLKADGEKTFTTDANLTFGAISDFSKVTVAQNTTLSLGHETLNLASTTENLEVNGTLNIVGKVNDGANSTVDVSSTLTGSGMITVGDPVGVGADIHVHSLAMTGGSLFIDPFYENAHSTMTVDEVSGGLNSNLTVGNNALLVIGDTLSNAQTALTKLTAQKPSFGEIRSIAYVATPINVLDHGSIIITPSASSVALNTDSSVTVTHTDASTTDFDATSVHVADYGALVINQEKIGSSTAFTGVSSISFADEGVLAIVNAEAGTIDLASSETSITAPRNVITDNPYYDGSVDENGNVVVEQNVLQGNLALASTGIQAMTRRADFVLAKTISNRSYEERESDVALWVDVGGEGYKATRLANGASFKSDMGYGVFGADYAFGNGVLAGAAFQYGKGTVRGGFESIKNKVKNYAGTAYVAFGPGKAKFVLDAAYVKQDNSITSAQTAFNQSVDSEMFSIGAAVRAGFNAGNFEFTPSFGLRFSKLKTDTMRSGNLELAKQNQTLIQAPISLRMKTRTTSADGWTIEPEAKISFVPTFGDKEVRILDSEQTVLDTNPIQGDIGVSLKKGNLKVDATFSYGAGSLGTTSVGGKVGLKYLF